MDPGSDEHFSIIYLFIVNHLSDDECDVSDLQHPESFLQVLNDNPYTSRLNCFTNNIHSTPLVDLWNKNYTFSLFC